MRDPQDIVNSYHERRQARGPLLARMQNLKQSYEGDVVVPLAELDRNERPAVANLLAQGLDQTALRISSTLPNVYFPPLKPGQKRSEEFSRIRRKATLGWWRMNTLDVKLQRRARHLIGYATSPVLIRPDKRRGIPIWELRDPLTTFPGPTTNPDDVVPDDCIFSFQRTMGWLRRRYGDLVMNLEKGADPSDNDTFTLLEYVDDVEHQLIVLGSDRVVDSTFPSWASVSTQQTRGLPWVQLENIANPTGLNPAVVAGRVSLGKPMGQFDGMIGLYQLQAKLMALDVIAVEKGVFPEMWMVARPNENPQIITQADSIQGITGEVKGADIKEIKVDPSIMSTQLIDRLERSQRISAGIPAEFGGESTTNVRTGRRGDAILSAVVDFPVQAAHLMLARSLEEENRRAIAIAKAYFGNRAMSFYVDWKGAKGTVDYTPNTHFEIGDNVVSYSQAGADINGLVVGLGQRVGIGTLSKRGAQELDPLIDDPELEHDRVVAEGLEQALLQSIEGQATQGAIPPVDLARIIELVRSNKMDLASAVDQAHQEAQKRQAAQPPPPGPGEAASPETQPGLGAPGQGAEQGAGAAVPPPAPSVQNLAQLLGNLRRPQTAGKAAV